LRKQLGEDAFNGLAALAECKHEVSLGYARTAAQSSNESYALAGLWLEAITYDDQGKRAQAEEVLANLVTKDPKIDSQAAAQASLETAMTKLQEIRKANNLPGTCN